MGELVVRRILVAVGLLAAVAGCSSPSPSSPAASGPAATTTPAALPTPTRFAGDLRTLLLAIPPTATKTAEKDHPDGTVTIEQAAKIYADPATGLRQLAAAGYQRGAEVEWIEADGTWIGVILAQLDTVDHATQYAQAQQSGFASQGIFGPALEIPGVAGGFVYQRTTISSNNRWFTEAVFSRHGISVELFVTGPKKLGPEKTIALAQAEYALLP
jgi:hypothetical protein